MAVLVLARNPLSPNDLIQRRDKLIARQKASSRRKDTKGEHSLKSRLFSVVSAIFGQVDGVMNPRHKPYMHWKAMLKFEEKL